MKSRIVFITHSPHFGGVEKHLIDLMRSFGGQQDCVVWYDPVDFYSTSFEGWPKVQILLRPYRINNRSIFRFWIELIRLQPRVVVFVKGIADIYPWSAYLAARLSGAERFIAIDHLIADPAPTPVVQAGIKGLARRLFGWQTRYMFGKRLQGNLVDITVAVSEAVRQRLVREYRYPAEKTVTIYNGIDLTPFSDGTVPQGCPVDARDSTADRIEGIICVARLSPVKRIDVLLEALALLGEKGKNWTCAIVGGGPLESELVKKAQSLGLASRVRFTGHVENVRSYMEAADLAVLSSDKEGLPLSLVEAMACGLPCVVTDVGGNREVVQHGITGLVVEAGSPKQLADAIAYLLDHSDERRAMGQAARCSVYERFNLTRMTEEYKALLFCEASSQRPIDRITAMRNST